MTAECLPSALTMRMARSGVTVKMVYSPAGRERSSTPKANGTLTFIRRSFGVVWANMVAAVNNRQIVIRMRALSFESLLIWWPMNPADRSHFAAILLFAQWTGHGMAIELL